MPPASAAIAGTPHGSGGLDAGVPPASAGGCETALIRSLFPGDVAVAAGAPASLQGPLLPEEKKCVEGTVPKRQLEFAAGRTCARIALARLGIVDYPLLPGPDRCPIWPAGVIGSISHADGFCGAAVARQEPSAGIGLDIESADGLEEALWPSVLRPAERHWLEQRSASEQRRLAKLVFSAKECAYKCQYGVYAQWLDFHDAEASFDLERSTFQVRFLKALGPDDASPAWVDGRFTFHERWVVTGSRFVFNNAPRPQG